MKKNVSKEPYIPEQPFTYHQKAQSKLYRLVVGTMSLIYRKYRERTEKPTIIGLNTELLKIVGLNTF